MLQRKRTSRVRQGSIASNCSSSSDSSSSDDDVSCVFTESFPALERGQRAISSINLARSKRRSLPSERKRRRKQTSLATPRWSPRRSSSFHRHPGRSNAAEADVCSMAISFVSTTEAPIEDRSLDSVSGTLDSCQSTGRHSNADTAIVTIDETLLGSGTPTNSTSGIGPTPSKLKNSVQVSSRYTHEGYNASPTILGGYEVVATTCNFTVTQETSSVASSTTTVSQKFFNSRSGNVKDIFIEGQNVPPIATIACAEGGESRRYDKGFSPKQQNLNASHTGAIANHQEPTQMLERKVIPAAISLQRQVSALRANAPVKGVISRKCSPNREGRWCNGAGKHCIKQAKERVTSDVGGSRVSSEKSSRLSVAMTRQEKKYENLLIKNATTKRLETESGEETPSLQQSCSGTDLNITAIVDKKRDYNHSSNGGQQGIAEMLDAGETVGMEPMSQSIFSFAGGARRQMNAKSTEPLARLEKLARTLDEHESRILCTGERLGLWNERSKQLAGEIKECWVGDDSQCWVGDDSQPDAGCCWQEDFWKVLNSGRPETQYLVHHDQY